MRVGIGDIVCDPNGENCVYYTPPDSSSGIDWTASVPILQIPTSYPSSGIVTYPTQPANPVSNILTNAANSIISRQANAPPQVITNPSTGQTLALYNPNTGQLIGGTAAGSVAGLGITSNPTLLLMGGAVVLALLMGRK